MVSAWSENLPPVPEAGLTRRGCGMKENIPTFSISAGNTEMWVLRMHGSELRLRQVLLPA